MISHVHKTIFVHVPKTAGTSIKETIGTFNNNLGYHARPAEIKSKHPNAWKNYHKFTVVRNPFDRVYSIYSYYRMGKKITLVDKNKLPKTFKEFVTDLDKYLKMLGLDYNQFDYIGDEINQILKFETLNKDFADLCNKLGIKGKRLRRDRPSTRQKDYHDVYDDEMVQIVSEYFKTDIKEFNYEF